MDVCVEDLWIDQGGLVDEIATFLERWAFEVCIFMVLVIIGMLGVVVYNILTFEHFQGHIMVSIIVKIRPTSEQRERNHVTSILSSTSTL
jgi:hypothetical protein